MAVRRKPLSASVQATLRRKAKASKKYTYGTLAKVYRRGQGAFLSAGKVSHLAGFTPRKYYYFFFVCVFDCNSKTFKKLKRMI